MKGVTFNAEKLHLWQCCGQYWSSGISTCPMCGRNRSDNRVSQSSNTESEQGQWDALEQAGQIKEFLPELAGRFRITIERYSPRLLDDDNFCGGCKQLRDAIAELLGKKGDSQADGLEFKYRQVKSKTKKTVIKIYAITQKKIDKKDNHA